MKKLLTFLLALGLSVPASAQMMGGLFGPTRNIQVLTGDPATCASGTTWVNSTTKIFKVCTDLNTVSSFLSSASTVVGPSSSTDNHFPRFDGVTGLLLQDGVLASADFNGDITGPSALTTTTGFGEAFTNQPANDGVELLSDSALDAQTATVIGTTNGTDTVVVELIALTGTTPVSTVKTDWGIILAVELSGVPTGIVTVREASGNATITTLDLVSSVGVVTVDAANQQAWNRQVSLVASGTSTKQVGLKGTDSAAAIIYDSQALSNTVPLFSNSAFATVTEIYVGALESNRTVTETATAGTKLDGEFISTGLQSARVTTQFDKTNDTLADVPGLLVNVEAGKTYELTIIPYVNSQAGGTKFAIGGTATATALYGMARAHGDLSAPQSAVGQVTTLGSSFIQESYAFGIDTEVYAHATITVNAGGTLTVQFAQSIIDATASSVLVGSTFTAQRIP